VAIRAVPPDAVAPIDVPERYVAGRALVHELSPALPTEQVRVNAVFFDPGSRFRPHRHGYDQVLYYASGTGVVAVDGGDDVLVPAGSSVVLPAGVLHMHGCTGEGPAMHISVMVDSETDFDLPCPDAWRKWIPAARDG
jgi:quercetin dioxygenase-like cupin family protein